MGDDIPCSSECSTYIYPAPRRKSRGGSNRHHGGPETGGLGIVLTTHPVWRVPNVPAPDLQTISPGKLPRPLTSHIIPPIKTKIMTIHLHLPLLYQI